MKVQFNTPASRLYYTEQYRNRQGKISENTMCTYPSNTSAGSCLLSMQVCALWHRDDLHAWTVMSSIGAFALCKFFRLSMKLRITQWREKTSHFAINGTFSFGFAIKSFTWGGSWNSLLINGRIVWTWSQLERGTWHLTECSCKISVAISGHSNSFFYLQAYLLNCYNLCWLQTMKCCVLLPLLYKSSPWM